MVQKTLHKSQIRRTKKASFADAVYSVSHVFCARADCFFTHKANSICHIKKNTTDVPLDYSGFPQLILEEAFNCEVQCLGSKRLAFEVREKRWIKFFINSVTTLLVFVCINWVRRISAQWVRRIVCNYFIDMKRCTYSR